MTHDSRPETDVLCVYAGDGQFRKEGIARRVFGCCGQPVQIQTSYADIVQGQSAPEQSAQPRPQAKILEEEPCPCRVVQGQALH